MPIANLTKYRSSCPRRPHHPDIRTLNTFTCIMECLSPTYPTLTICQWWGARYWPLPLRRVRAFRGTGKIKTADMTRRNTLLRLHPTPLRAVRPPGGAACQLSVWDLGAETVVAMETVDPVQLVVRGSDLSTSADSPLPPRSRAASISSFLTARNEYPCRWFLLSHDLRHVLIFELRFRLGLFSTRSIPPPLLLLFHKTKIVLVSFLHRVPE